MLVEAVNLFIKLVKVISTRTFYMTYLAIGWGRLKVFRPAEIIRKIVIENGCLREFKTNRNLNSYYLLHIVYYLVLKPEWER